MKKLLIPFFTIFLFSVNTFTGVNEVFAEILTESEATPSVISEIGAKIAITEVNFKNSQADWVELYYSSPTSKPLNINGIGFADDSAFKKISQNITIQSGQYLLLYFKNSNPDQPPYFYTSRTGLTATTEQFILYDQNNKVLDAVCWASEKPTTSEIAELSELHTTGGWGSAMMESCLQSEKVDTDFSIARHPNTDTNSKTDWFIGENPTPGSQNVLATPTEPVKQETAPKNEESEEILEDEADFLEEDEAEITALELEEIEDSGLVLEDVVAIEVPESTTTKTAKKEAAAKKTKAKTTTKKTSSKTPVYQNGDLSETIIISEVMPNPEKDDNKNEWIELYNQGEEDVNLGNWKLDDSENGSKPYVFSDETIIKAGSALLVPITDSKLSLANKEDSVRLFNYEDAAINEITYEEAPNGKSYAFITILKEDETEEAEWQWLAEPTPDSPNPTYQELNAEISSEPQFGEQYSFEVKDEKDQLKTIVFDESIIAAPLARATFTKGSRIKLVLVHNEDEIYSLKNYEILSAPAAQQDSGLLVFSIIGSILMIGGICVYIFRKKLASYLKK